MSLFIAPRISTNDGSRSAQMSRDVSIAELSRMTGDVRQWRNVLNPKILEELHKQDRDETFCGCFKRVYDAFGLRHIIPVLILAAYSFAGAAVVYHYEYINEVETKTIAKLHTDNTREQLIRNLTQIILGTSELSDSLLNETRQLLISYDKAETKYVDVNLIRWDFWSALFFTVTIYTTIGYGNLSPVTTEGRLFTIFYAVIGIPLLLAILSDLGDVLYRYSGLLYRKLKRRKPKPKNDNSDPFKEETAETSVAEEEEDKDIPMWLAVGITVAWLFISSAFFLIMETDWTYFQSFYFFFISFSTIGLGDIVPDNPRYMVMNFWLVLIGLSLVSMTISIIQSKIEEFLFRVMKRIREEYNKLIGAVEAEQDETGEGEVTEGQKRLVMDKVWDSQPWYVKSFLPKVLNERQKEVLEDHNNIVAFVITHSKKIQTDTNWDSFEYQHDPTDLNSGGQHFHSQHQPSADVCIQVAFQEDDLLEMQVEQCHVGAQTAQLDFVSQICQTDTLATFTAEIQLQTEPIGMRDESQQTGVFVGGILRSLSRKSETSRVSFVSDYSQPSTPANGSVAIRDFDTVSWNSVASVPTMAHNSVDSRGLKRQKAFHHSDSNESFNQQPGKVVVRKAHTIVNIPCSDTQDSLLYPVYKSIYKSKSVPMAIIAENGNCRYYANDSFSAEEPQLSITVVPESESTSTDDIFVDAQSDFPQINSIPNISFFPTESINIFNVTDETGNAGHNSTLLNTLNSRKLSNGDLVRNAEFSAEDNQAQIDSEFSDTTKLLPQAIRKLSQSGPVRKLSQQLRKPSLLEVNGQMVVANINGDLMTVGETPRETSFEPVRKLSRAGERKLSCSHRPPVITDDCGVQTDCPRDMGLIRDRSINVSNEISDRSSQTEEKSVREMATNTVKIKKLSPPTTAVKFDVDIQTEPHASDMVDRSIQTKDSWLRIANRINTYQSNRAPSLMISRAPMIKRSLPDPIQPAIVEEEESN